MYLIKDLIGGDHSIWVGEKVQNNQQTYDSYRFYDDSKWGETCNLQTCQNNNKCTQFYAYQTLYWSYNASMQAKAENLKKLTDKEAACNSAINNCENALTLKGLYLPIFFIFH